MKPQIRRLSLSATPAPKGLLLLLSSGLILIAIGAIRLAAQHADQLGVICGLSSTPHCGWCVVAVVAALSAGAVLIRAFARDL